MSSDNNVSYDAANVVLNPWQKFCYSSGALVDNVPWGLIMSFLLFFWTDVLMIPATVCGTFLLVTKLWDAINDPIVGFLADKTNTKMGRYRPWLWAFIPMLIFTALCFLKIPGASLVVQCAFSFGIYFCMVFFFTAFDIPHTALMASLTLDGNSRASLATYRMFFGCGCNLVIAGAFTGMTGMLGKGDVAKGYFLTTVIFCIVMVPFALLCIRGTKERVPVQSGEKVSFSEALASLKGNRPAKCLFVAFLAYGTMGGLTGAARMYYFTYYVGDLSKFSANIVAFLLGMTVGTLICNFMMRFVKNKRTTPMISWIIAAICVFAATFTRNMTLFNVLTFLFGAFASSGLTGLYAMVPDVTEYAQVKSGVRAGGVLFSVVNFGSKFGMAFSGAIFGWVLGSMGYVAGAAQPQSLLNVMNWSMNGMCGIVLVVAIVAMVFYNLDKKTHAELVQKLQTKSHEHIA